MLLRESRIARRRFDVTHVTPAIFKPGPRRFEFEDNKGAAGMTKWRHRRGGLLNAANLSVKMHERAVLISGQTGNTRRIFVIDFWLLKPWSIYSHPWPSASLREFLNLSKKTMERLQKPRPACWWHKIRPGLYPRTFFRRISSHVHSPQTQAL